jgi:hypothetical protein
MHGITRYDSQTVAARTVSGIYFFRFSTESSSNRIIDEGNNATSDGVQSGSIQRVRMGRDTIYGQYSAMDLMELFGSWTTGKSRFHRFLYRNRETGEYLEPSEINEWFKKNSPQPVKTSNGDTYQEVVEGSRRVLYRYTSDYRIRTLERYFEEVPIIG